jgi:hypothetical protein
MPVCHLILCLHKGFSMPSIRELLPAKLSSQQWQVTPRRSYDTSKGSMSSMMRIYANANSSTVWSKDGLAAFSGKNASSSRNEELLQVVMINEQLVAEIDAMR